MPTAGRLAGAIAFAIFGWVLATTAAPYFDEGQTPGFWLPLGIVAGIFVGWVVVGKRTGRGFGAGIANGITGALALVFWMLFILSFGDMITKSMRRAYDGPVEAIVDVFTIISEYALQFATVEIWIIVAAGAVIAGLFAEFFGSRFS